MFAAAFPTSGGSVDKNELKLLCPMCEKQVTLREDTCTNENGDAVHTDCYAKRILQETQTGSRDMA
jgi:hypothetical protein